MHEKFIKKLNDKYHEYKNSSEKNDLNLRLIENEKWFRKKQDEIKKTTDTRIPALKGGYLFNAIITKHADAMDNFPDISILPREERDKDLADTLSGIIPYILERCEFEKVYSDNWYSKLKTSSCYSVVWDPDENNGSGDIKITKTDLLNLFCQPGICDIEQSEFVFYHTYIPKKAFIDTYGAEKIEETESVNSIDTYEKTSFELKNEFVLIIDAYYKKKVKGKTILHFAKFSGKRVLFSSEDEKNEDGTASYPNGYYDHGKYPFIFDIMYPAEQSLSGFGLVDVVKDIQEYIDATDELIQVNNRIVGKPRIIYSKSLGLSSRDLADLNKEFIEAPGNVDPNSIYKLSGEALPAQVLNSLMHKKEELKEIIGNRDFQQGGTSGGVTSGSAISILQSAGDKLSRDLIKASYRSYKKIILLIIELIRQFYDEERTFRITGKDGSEEFVRFSNRGMKGSFGTSASAVPYNTLEHIDLGAADGAPVGVGLDLTAHAVGANPHPTTHQNSGLRDIPLFDVKLSVQKSNPYSRELNNQTVLELASRGLLNPQNFEINLPVLNALQFDGKDALIKELRETFERMKNQTTSQAGGASPSPTLSGSIDKLIPDNMGDSSLPLRMTEDNFRMTDNSAGMSGGADDEFIDITDLIQGE